MSRARAVLLQKETAAAAHSLQLPPPITPACLITDALRRVVGVTRLADDGSRSDRESAWGDDRRDQSTVARLEQSVQPVRFGRHVQKATTTPRGRTMTGQRASSMSIPAALIVTRPVTVPGFEPTIIRSTSAVARGATVASSRRAIPSAVLSEGRRLR